jgi:hypothetical protein
LCNLLAPSLEHNGLGEVEILLVVVGHILPEDGDTLLEVDHDVIPLGDIHWEAHLLEEEDMELVQNLGDMQLSLLVEGRQQVEQHDEMDVVGASLVSVHILDHGAQVVVDIARPDLVVEDNAAVDVLVFGSMRHWDLTVVEDDTVARQQMDEHVLSRCDLL